MDSQPLSTLFVMDPVSSLNLAGDSTYMLMVEASRRGWPVAWCTPNDLFARQGDAWCRAQRVTVDDRPPHFHPVGTTADEPVGAFDVVWMRKDPPFDMHYVFSTYLLDLVPPETLVLNRPSSIRDSNEKMVALQWPHFCPTTLVTREISRAMAFAAAAPGRVVVKPWDGNGGRGVLVSQHGDGNLRSMIEVLTNEQRDYILVQHHIPEIADGDKRIVLIDGEPRGWMLRVPQPGDHRGNMHVGARVEACELSERDREICDALGPRLREEGLLFVGIDTIGPYLTEVNVTSPTGIREINQLMDLHLEIELTDAVVRAHQAHRSGLAR